MKKSILPMVALASVVALGAGCNNNGSNASTTKTTAANPPPQGQTTTPAPAPLSEDDKEFMTKAAQGGMLEVQLGREVSQKAKNPVVKNFADQMVKDHGKANDELKDLAAKKGVKLPTQLNDDKKDDLQKFAKESGTELDKDYADDMVDDHEKDVKDFKDAAKDLKDPDLRAWAQKTVPVLEHHLDMAKDMKAKTKNEK